MRVAHAAWAQPRLLCLDTTTERMVVAVTDGETTLTLEEAGGARASKRLLAAAQELMNRAQWPWASLDAIAFGRGPGAFTGLRTAASVTQGLALGLDRPTLAIDSLLIVADAAWFDAAREQVEHEPAKAAVNATNPTDVLYPADIWVAMDARMGEIYATAYRHQATDAWQPLGDAQLLSVHGFNAAFARTPSLAVAGSALDAFATQIQLPPSTRLVPNPPRRGKALARLALAAWAQGLQLDAALAVPVYVRDKVALTTAERQAAVNRSASAQHVTDD